MTFTFLAQPHPWYTRHVPDREQLSDEINVPSSTSVANEGWAESKLYGVESAVAFVVNAAGENEKMRASSFEANHNILTHI